jgi:peptidoglycan hydrolase CwlO-like protein
MFKKVLILGAVVLAGLFVAKKTHLCSYVSTVWNEVRQEARAQIPTRFELDRMRNEIGRMDNDIRDMVGPIAEHMADVSKLKKDIEKTRTGLTQQKAALQTLLSGVQKGEEFVVYGDTKLTPKRAQQQVESDFRNCKNLETHLATQEKLLTNKERALEATRDHLNKMIAQKREFELQLAELETAQEVLDAQTTGTSPIVDSGRATEIRATLERIQRLQEVARNKLALLNGGLTPEPVAPGNQNNTVNLDEVRNYLNPPAPNGNTRTARQ